MDGASEHPAQGQDDIRHVETNLPSVKPVAPDEVDLDNGWTEYREQIVDHYRKEALKYRYMHRESVKHYALWRNVLEISLILLGSLGTLLTIWSNNVTEQINKVIIWLSAFTSVLNKFLSYPQQQVQHTVAGKKFLELYNSAQLQLLAPRRQRAHAQTYLQDLLNSFAALEGASPDIPKWIKDDLRKNPDKLSDVYQIEIPRTGDMNAAEEGRAQDLSSNFVRDNNIELAQTTPQLNESAASKLARVQLQRYGGPISESFD